MHIPKTLFTLPLKTLYQCQDRDWLLGPKFLCFNHVCRIRLCENLLFICHKNPDYCGSEPADGNVLGYPCSMRISPVVSGLPHRFIGRPVCPECPACK